VTLIFYVHVQQVGDGCPTIGQNVTVTPSPAPTGLKPGEPPPGYPTGPSTRLRQHQATKSAPGTPRCPHHRNYYSTMSGWGRTSLSSTTSSASALRYTSSKYTVPVAADIAIIAATMAWIAKWATSVKKSSSLESITTTIIVR